MVNKYLKQMIQKAPELQLQETVTSRELFDKTKNLVFGCYNDFFILRRIVAILMSFYCEKYLIGFTYDELIVMFIMKERFRKHWIEGEWK